MTRNYNFREPKILVRAVLGALLFANLVAAAFAFHIVGDSPAELEAELNADRTSFRAAQQRLNKSKALVRNMTTSREQGQQFLASYMASRKHYNSTIDGE